MDKPRHPHVIRTWRVERIQTGHQKLQFRKPRADSRPANPAKPPAAPPKHQP